jgi:hypothetical protein
MELDERSRIWWGYKESAIHVSLNAKCIPRVKGDGSGNSTLYRQFSCTCWCYSVLRKHTYLQLNFFLIAGNSKK